MNSEVTITLPGGTVVDTWDEVDIELDMLSAGSAWTLSLWWSDYLRSTWRVLQEQALRGARVTVAIDGAVQLVGLIEDRDDSGGEDGGMMVISGRDLAGPAIDGDADPRIQLRGLTLADALERIFEVYGYNVRCLSGSGARLVQALRNRHRGAASARVARTNPVRDFRIEPGMKSWAVADQICRTLGFMIWTAPYPDDDPPGLGVVVDAPAETGEPQYRFERIRTGQYTYRGNILHGRHKINGRGVPSTVTAFAHTKLSAMQDARQRADVENSAVRDRWTVASPVPCPRYLHPADVHDVAGARRASEREIARANAGYRGYTCLVKDFSQVFGGEKRIFTTNALASVRDDFHDLDETMLMTSVRFSRSRGKGDLTAVRMAPKGAIKVIPED
jgi:prophage tail gpP-like protein